MKSKIINKVWFLILGIVFLFFETSFSQNIKGSSFCNANFNFRVLESYSPLTYKFENHSTSNSIIIKYQWNFGDGEYSSSENPIHQYLQEGEFIVQLKVLNADGDSSTFTDTLEIFPLALQNCSAYFTYMRVTSSPDYTFKFTDHSIHTGDTINTWKWTFGDGTAAVFVQDPQHQYMSAGNYLVTLEINTNSGCSSSYSVTVQIQTSPNPCDANFSFNKDTLVTSGLKYIFHDNSTSSTQINQWFWKFGDGDSSNLQDPTHTFPYAGIYYVSLKIKTSANNTSEITIPIQVGNPKPYNLWGKIYAGSYIIDKCIAYIYREFNNNYFVPFDTVQLTSVNDTLGVYYFFQIPEGKYRVKVQTSANSIYADEYAPTYYGNQKFWNQSSSIQLFANVSLANINLVKVLQSTGTNQINGKINNQNGSLSTIKGIEILLLDNNNAVVDYTFTDNAGNFTFQKVVSGNLHIYAELTGYNCQPISLNLNTSFDTIHNLTIYINNNSFVGFYNQESNNGINSFNIYPNPTSGTICINTNFDGEINIEIYDMIGKKVESYNLEKDTNSISLDISKLNSGIFIIKIIETKSSKIGFGKIIKK